MSRWHYVAAGVALLSFSMGCTRFESPLAQEIKSIKAFGQRGKIGRYIEQGSRDDLAGNYAAARDAYAQALTLDRELSQYSQGLTPAAKSMVTYNLGRMNGYLCHFGEAERFLVQALEMEKSLQGRSDTNISKRLFELARLSFDQNKFVEAVSYYDQAFKASERLSVAAWDPIGFATVLEDYALALRQAGAGDQATAASAQAKALRDANPDASARFVPIHYRDVCKVNSLKSSGVQVDVWAALSTELAGLAITSGRTEPTR